MKITDFHIQNLKAAMGDSQNNLDQVIRDFELGRTVYLRNRNRKIKPLGIGPGFPTRVNVNVGTSGDADSMELEIAKVRLSEELKADTVMDLSTGKTITETRKSILSETCLPIGTVPIYEIYSNAKEKDVDFNRISAQEMLETVKVQAEQGVDFMTIHAGITLACVKQLAIEKRLMGIVSRGGSMLAGWMLANKSENPFLTHYDDLMGIMKEHNVVISLGDGLRPGCIFDATDQAQLQELLELGRLVRRSQKAGVQVIVEGPGHVPLSEIPANILLQKKLCHDAPFYVLGPIPLDIAPGYDHIASAIGGAIAASKGADFLCYVTPAEHLRLPDLSDVRQGIMASRIAAHIGDLEKGNTSAWEMNREMNKARADLDWKKQESLCVDPAKFREYRESIELSDQDTCSMCGKLCAVKLCKEAMEAS